MMIEKELKNRIKQIEKALRVLQSNMDSHATKNKVRQKDFESIVTKEIENISSEIKHLKEKQSLIEMTLKYQAASIQRVFNELLEIREMLKVEKS